MRLDHADDDEYRRLAELLEHVQARDALRELVNAPRPAPIPMSEKLPRTSLSRTDVCEACPTARAGTGEASALPCTPSRQHAGFGERLVARYCHAGGLFAFGEDGEEQLAATAIKLHVASSSMQSSGPGRSGRSSSRAAARRRPRPASLTSFLPVPESPIRHSGAALDPLALGQGADRGGVDHRLASKSTSHFSRGTRRP